MLVLRVILLWQDKCVKGRTGCVLTIDEGFVSTPCYFFRLTITNLS